MTDEVRVLAMGLDPEIVDFNRAVRLCLVSPGISVAIDTERVKLEARLATGCACSLSTPAGHAAPSTKICFNTRPDDTVAAVQRCV